MSLPAKSPLPPDAGPQTQLAALAQRSPWPYAAAAVALAARQVRPLAALLAALTCALLAMAAAFWLLALVTATPLAVLTRDLAATTGAKFYIGALSSITAVLWTAAATVCCFGAMTLRHAAPPGGRRAYLLGAALLTAALGADDLFMLHEVVYPKLFALDEAWVFALYGAAFAALVLRCRSAVLASEVLLLMLALLLFGGSLLVDQWIANATAAEDFLKLAGVACWLTYFWRFALAGLAAPPVDGRTMAGLSDDQSQAGERACK